MLHDKKGFTLIEMLVVVAIIAVLVAILVPTIASVTIKAKAATDAANLRSILGVMNAGLASDKAPADIVKGMNPPDSKVVDGAKPVLLYDQAGFIKVYFMKADQYYGLDYFTKVSETGKTDSAFPEGKPAMTPGSKLYEVGTGNVIS